MDSNCVETLSVADALIFLQLKDKIPSGRLINLKGKVTSVSEKFRVKKDLLFLIEVETCLKILVKQKAYLVWQEQIHPEEEYVFTNLRATTLQKGSALPSRLFIPWSKSIFSLSSECKHKEITLQQWFQGQGIHASHIDLSELESQPDVNISAKFVSYQGIITSSAQSSLGIYELDHRLRLYVSSVPAVHKFKFLNVGARVVVYNAHRRGFSKAPKIRLFCCVCSSVRVIEADDIKDQAREIPMCSPLLQPISVYSLNTTETVELMELPSYLVDHLSLPDSPMSQASVMRLITFLLSGVCCSWLQENHRNLIQEFLDVPHNCCFSKLKHKSRIPSILSMESVNSELKEMSHDLTDLQEKYYGSHLPMPELNQRMYWNPVSALVDSTSRTILLGFIHCNPVTGRLQLQDASGFVDVLCLSSQPGSHLCSPECLNPRDGSPITCPVMHSNLIGSLICVRKYKCVAERFLITDFPNSYHIDLKYVSCSRYVTYLVFSLTDCVLLHCPSGHSQKSQVSKGKCLKRTYTSTHESQFEDSVSTHAVKRKKRDCSTSVASKLLYVSHKESLMTVNRNVAPKLRFSVLGHFITEPSPSPDPVLSAESQLTHLKKRCPNAQGKENCEKTNNHLTRTEQAVSSRPTQQYCKRSEAVESPSGGPEPVVLLFQDSVQWFPVIQPGGIYRLSLEGEDDLLTPKIQGEKLQRVAKSSCTRMCVQVPSQATLTREFAGQDSMVEGIDYTAIEDILSDSFSANHVSLYGRLVSRSHEVRDSPSVGRHKHFTPSRQIQLANEKLGVSLLANASVRLQVQSLTSAREITVYMNLQATSYPLGLLSGSGVEFQRLERKVSCIDKVYCQYTAVSTVSVFDITDTPLQRLERTALCKDVEVRTPAPPDQHIVTLWQDAAAHQIFRAHVYISHFLKLCLKSVCSICGSNVSSMGCSSPACNSTDSQLTCRVHVLVDDGTSPAVVMFAKCPSLVQKLLRFSTEQWRHLELATQEQGDVFMKQFVGDGRSILESFLMRLCNSRHIKRQCHMTLQHQETHDGSCNTWRTGFADISKMSKDEFAYHSVKASAMFETRCLPYLLLECVGLEDDGE